jgi:hypothetical protein
MYVCTYITSISIRHYWHYHLRVFVLDWELGWRGVTFILYYIIRFFPSVFYLYMIEDASDLSVVWAKAPCASDFVK